jgi:hypothetical protein
VPRCAGLRHGGGTAYDGGALSPIPLIQESAVTLSPEEIDCLPRWSRTRGCRRTLANTFPPPHPLDLVGSPKAPPSGSGDEQFLCQRLQASSRRGFVSGREESPGWSGSPGSPPAQPSLLVWFVLSVFQEYCRILLVFRSPSSLLLESAPAHPWRRQSSGSEPGCRRAMHLSRVLQRYCCRFPALSLHGGDEPAGSTAANVRFREGALYRPPFRY